MATLTVNDVQLQIRNDVAQNWATENPVLKVGELGLETDTGNAKFGDGTTTWNSLKYAFRRNNTRNIEYIVGTQTASTAALKGATEDASLYDGKCINYYLPYASKANATLELTFPSGSTSGAKPIYIVNTTRLGTQYGAGTIFQMTYSATQDAWYCGNYWVSNTNNYDRRLHNNNIKAASAITLGFIIVGDKNGYKNVTANATFDISYPIMYASKAIAANKYAATAYECMPGVNLQTTVANWEGTQDSIVYLVGTLSGTTFTIDSSVFTTTVPSTADGKVYIPIGILYSTYQVFFAPTRDMYAYYNGAFRPYDPTTAAAGTSNGQVKINGTDITVYTHPTTAGNKHIPSGGSANQVLTYGGSSGTASWGAVPSHSHVGTEVTLTGYSKPSSTSAVAATDTANAAIGKLEKGLDGKAASSHNQASNTINAMTGYSKPSTTSAITASDSLNTAIGKLEKALEPDVSLSINDPGGSAVWIEVPVEHLIVGSTTPTDHNAIWIEIIA